MQEGNMAKYYGQKFNRIRVDQHIAKFFPKGFVGSAIEVGACDGIRYSNTYHFELGGWTCLCIEPNHKYYKRLKQNRKHSMPYACGAENKNNVEFTVFQVKRMHNESAISSLNPSKDIIDSHKNLILGQHKELVNVRTLDYCIEEFGQFETIDFISIDTEGTEFDVLQGFNIVRWMPKLFIIENNLDSKQYESYLKSFGYGLAKREPPNDFYLRK